MTFVVKLRNKKGEHTDSKRNKANPTGCLTNQIIGGKVFLSAKSNVITMSGD